MLRALMTRLRWPLLGGAVGLLAVTTTALAGSGVGAVFNLGLTNTVDAQSTLSGNPGANPLLRITGSGTAATVRVDAGTGPAINGISNSGTGQFGQSTTGIGVQGNHAASTGVKPGVEGRTSSTDPGAVGVLGQSVGGVGVHGLGAKRGLVAELTGSPTTADSAIEALVTGHGQGLHIQQGNGLLRGDAVGILVEGVDHAIRVSGGGSAVSSSTPLIEATNAYTGGLAVSGTATGPNGVGLQGQADNSIGAVGVLGKSTSGVAGRFEGRVHVTGKLTRAYTAGSSSQATPIAYGHVTSGGSTVTTASTPNVTSTFDSVNKRYVITITGEAYDISHYVTQATPINSSAPRFIATQSSGGKLLVKVFDLAGAAVQTPFTFVTYKP